MGAPGQAQPQHGQQLPLALYVTDCDTTQYGCVNGLYVRGRKDRIRALCPGQWAPDHELQTKPKPTFRRAFHNSGDFSEAEVPVYARLRSPNLDHLSPVVRLGGGEYRGEYCGMTISFGVSWKKKPSATRSPSISLAAVTTSGFAIFTKEELFGSNGGRRIVSSSSCLLS